MKAAAEYTNEELLLALALEKKKNAALRKKLANLEDILRTNIRQAQLDARNVYRGVDARPF